MRKTKTLLQQSEVNLGKRIDKTFKVCMKKVHKNIKAAINKGELICYFNIDYDIDYQHKLYNKDNEITVYKRMIPELNKIYEGQVDAFLNCYGFQASYIRLGINIVK